MLPDRVQDAWLDALDGELIFGRSMTLHIVFPHLFSDNFHVLENDNVVAEARLSGWREQAEFRIGDANFLAYREGLFGGAFILSSNGTQVARAEKPSAFREAFFPGFGTKVEA